MKTGILSAMLILFSLMSLCQGNWDLNFEDSNINRKVVFQQKSNGINHWQIGTPGKAILNRAYSESYSIITDTLQTYTTNDTSSFIVLHQAGMGWEYGYPKIDICGWYFVNSDSLTDYGFIEFSTDQGNSWHRTDSALYNGCCSWGAVQDLPVLTGNSYDWKAFCICICPPVKMQYNDTVQYRFTFISDGIDTQKDGLMFDNLHFEDWAEGLEEKVAKSELDISPNPVNHYCIISLNNMHEQAAIEIINLQGATVYTNENYHGEALDLSLLTEGIYLVKASVGKRYFQGKLIKQKQ